MTSPLGGAPHCPRHIRRFSRLAFQFKGGHSPQGRALLFAPSQGPREPAFAPPLRRFAYPLSTNIPYAAARNELSSRRQQPADASTGSTATPQLLRGMQDQYRAEQAAQVARPDDPPGRYVSFDCRAADRPHRHPYRSCAWTMCSNCIGAGHTQRECTKVRADCDGGLRRRRCAVVFCRFGRVFKLTRAAGFRVLCSLVGLRILWE